VKNPDGQVKAVMMGYDIAPFGVYALKSSGIKTPKDLEGKKLGAPVFDASFKLFPAYAAQVGIDRSKITHINLQPPLREPSLKNPDGQVKAVMMGYDIAPFGVYALKSSGIKTPKDLEGKKLGAPVFDASFKLFPAYAAKVGIDRSKITHINLQPPLREPSLKN